ncbi:ParB N-terminal domain-containing protein [Nonomuraea sp. B12E4]|uniref:ParB/RepB/Spo0J family partition protein n=1 Tax=Nonomuraea sp. B12E4 TaxID=3153564 RepID=UPI00325EDD38
MRLEIAHQEVAHQEVEEQVVEIDIGLLVAADSPRIQGQNQDHVHALATLDIELPPILVHRATMRVVDGMHRLRAAELRGARTIAVRFFDGSERDAFVLAVRENVAHGLPLSLADRKAAAERIVLSHPQWSDRMIASVSGVAAATVAEIRKARGGIVPATESRIGLDGRVRPVSGVAARRFAGRLMTENPTLSLRQVAQAVGISPETVRDVRQRLNRGEDPVPAGRGRRKAAPHAARQAATPQHGVTARLADETRAGGAPRATGGAPGSAEARASVVSRLRDDPAMRLNEAGRSLLRLLAAHTMDEREWDRMIANVPPHRARTVGHLARELAALWTDVAHGLECQAASVS